MAKKATTRVGWRDHIKSVSELVAAVGVIGAAAVGAGTWCVSQANASTNKKLDDISAKIDVVELNSTRNQLLTLMSDYPDNESEILKVADYYFNDINGDWYMTELFTKWCDSRGIDVNKIINIRK